MKQHGYIAAFLIAFLAILAPPGSAGAADVVVVLSADLPPYIEAAEGVREALGGSGMEVRELSLSGKQEKWADVAEQLRNESPKVVVPLGSLATALVAKKLDGDADIVYSMILNPETLLRDVPTDRRITGVSMNVNPADVFGGIRKALPRARKVGVLYDPARSGDIVEEARQAAAPHAFQLIAKEVNDARDLPRAVKELCDERVDVLWLFVDRTVLQTREGLELIIVETLRKGIPIVAPSDRYVKAGALIGFSVNYRDLGRQTGDLVTETVRSNAVLPGSQRPQQLSISVNEKVREAMGVQMPSVFLEDVDRYMK